MKQRRTFQGNYSFGRCVRAALHSWCFVVSNVDSVRVRKFSLILLPLLFFFSLSALYLMYMVSGESRIQINWFVFISVGQQTKYIY